MKNKRMFSTLIIDTDAFMDMPPSSQMLYFHLCMRADDDGFIANPKKIMRMVGSQEDDMKILTAKRFLLAFDSGVVVIKHWRIHNWIRNDRYLETNYQKELKQLVVDPKTKKYSLGKPKLGLGMTSDIPLADPDKIRLDKISIYNKKDIPKSLTLEEQIKPLKSKYSPSMIEDFILHFSETDKKGKQRWQLEKTWDISKRLIRWKKQGEVWDRKKFIKSAKDPEPKVRKDGGSGFEAIGSLIKP